MKYEVIYADPPWDIGSINMRKWTSQLNEKYPTMKPEELTALPVKKLSAEDSVCFMWVTLSRIEQGLQLLNDWGFKYHITLTWDKGSGWSSCGFHRKTELVLVGYKGRLTKVVKQKGKYIPTVFYEAKTIHSRKPLMMYEYIENHCLGNKLEMFARVKRKGWDIWGNELTNDIDLHANPKEAINKARELF